VRLRVFFRWYDFWIGAFYDRRDKILYICPVPMFGVAIWLPIECEICGFIGRHAVYCVKGRYERRPGH
jgi:hypothetical protein